MGALVAGSVALVALLGFAVLFFAFKRALYVAPGHGLSAVQVAQRLRALGLPIGEVQAHRAPAYQSDATFADTRLGHRAGTHRVTVLDGGAVEIFPSSEAATSRMDNLRAGARLRGESDYMLGLVVLRLSPKLKGAQASRYQTALPAAAKPRR